MESQNTDNLTNEPYGSLESKVKFHSEFVEKVLFYCLWLCAFVMFSILLCGIYEIGMGIYHMFYKSINCSLVKSSLLSDILNGLELIFVSPLIYLLLLSLFKYVNAVKLRRGLDLKEKNKSINNALLEIMMVKILSVALFISILILHSVDLILNNEMSINLITYNGIILIILISYYYLLDHLANGLKKRLLEE